MPSTWDDGASTWDGGASIWDGPPPAPTVKYAAAIAYDGVDKFAKALAVNGIDGAARAVDSGGSSYASPAELDEAEAALVAAGYVTQRTLYPDKLLDHAQADALALAGAAKDTNQRGSPDGESSQHRRDARHQRPQHHPERRGPDRRR